MDARNPLLLLGETSRLAARAGEPFMRAGNSNAVAGYLRTFNGFPLPNKVLRTTFTGGQFITDFRSWEISNSPATFPFYLYFGAETFGQVAQVPASRRDEFEELLLKVTPAQQWLGLFVEYV